MAWLDEHEAHQRLEELCGSSHRAFRMLGLYKRANQAGSDRDRQTGRLDTDEVFKNLAKRDGYSNEAVRHYLWKIR